MAIKPHQALIRSAALCEELEINKGTLSRWERTNPELRAARISRGIWSVQRLRDAGLLPRVVAA